MSETLQLLSIISFAIAVACLVLAIFLWFFFKIPNIIGDLSGRTARKSIAKMRAANEKTGSKSYRESKANAERGKLTETIPVMQTDTTSTLDNNRLETGLLNENRTERIESKATDMLKSETTGLLVNDKAMPNVSVQNSIAKADKKELIILEEVILIHTDEVIG